MGMSFLLKSLHMLISFFIFACYLLGSFLVNGISTFILFDLGATRSFMSLALSKSFIGAPSELD